ncbi:MAG: AI-2E family transporter [Verrucomicrobiota bacterium]
MSHKKSGMIGESEEQPRPGVWRREPVLGIAALLLLLVGCFFVVRPFLTALVWAIVLTYSLFPLQRRFTRWFRGSRTLAACFVTLTVSVLLIGPVILIGISLAQDGRDLAKASRTWFLSVSEKPPEWMENVPVVGDDLSGYWGEFVEDRDRWVEQFDEQVTKTEPLRPKIVVEELDGEMRVVDAPPLELGPVPLVEEAGPLSSGPSQEEAPPHIVRWLGKFIAWAKTGLILAGKVVLGGVTEVIVSALLAFFLLRDAPILAERLQTGVTKLAGSRGHHLIKVAGDTVRGVIYGIIGTALTQALVAGLGFWIARVPGAVLLAVLTFLFAVVPFGPPLIWVPASIWLFAQGEQGWGIFMLCWGLFGISSVDNVIRPLIISQGSKMPFALIFCGVIGGLIAFGLVGVFLGPTLLAVAFRLIEEWSREPVVETPEEEPRILLPGAR